MTNKKGYTLLELITVVVILAALLALAAPTFSKFNKNWQEKICSDNRSRLVQAIRSDQAAGKLEGSDEIMDEGRMEEILRDYEKRYGQSCPEGGYYKLETEEGIAVLTCDIHSTAQELGRIGNIVSNMQQMLKELRESEATEGFNRYTSVIDSTADEEKSTYLQFINQGIRDQLQEANANTWTIKCLYNAGRTPPNYYQMFWSHVDLAEANVKVDDWVLCMKYNENLNTYTLGYVRVISKSVNGSAPYLALDGEGAVSASDGSWKECAGQSAADKKSYEKIEALYAQVKSQGDSVIRN